VVSTKKEREWKCLKLNTWGRDMCRGKTSDVLVILHDCLINLCPAVVTTGIYNIHHFICTMWLFWEAGCKYYCEAGEIHADRPALIIQNSRHLVVSACCACLVTGFSRGTTMLTDILDYYVLWLHWPKHGMQ
jgi:hypothetical protein